MSPDLSRTPIASASSKLSTPKNNAYSLFQIKQHLFIKKISPAARFITCAARPEEKIPVNRLCLLYAHPIRSWLWSLCSKQLWVINKVGLYTITKQEQWWRIITPESVRAKKNPIDKKQVSSVQTCFLSIGFFARDNVSFLSWTC